MIRRREAAFYTLAGQRPERVADEATWLKICRTGSPEWCVAHDLIFTTRISTIFLGIDMRFDGDGPPLLFETNVFGGKYTYDQIRTCTWEEAEAAHAEAVALVRKSAVA